MSHYLKVSDLSTLMSDLEFTSLSPSMLSNVDSMFWMYADDRPYFQETDISALCNAFGDVKPVLWFVALGKGSLEQLQDYHRGFGFKASGIKYIQRMDIIRQDRPKKIYADVVWLSQELYPLVADILSANSQGLSLALSFIPNTSGASYTWANATIGLLWQNMIGSNKLNAQQQRYRELAYRNILEYVQMTTKISGVALMSASDIDMKPSILGFGSHISIQNALEQLATDFEVTSESEGHRQFLRKRPNFKGTF